MNESQTQEITVDNKEIGKWSWGGFFLTWIWGIGNNTFVALLALIPVLNLLMSVVLGFKGNEWAWKNKKWESVEEFHRVQRLWTKWGVIVWLVGALFFITVIGGTFSFMKNTPVYKRSFALVQSTDEITERLGTPIKSGFFIAGRIDAEGASGNADLSYKITGPDGSGTIFITADKESGQWTFKTVVFEENNTKERLTILDD
jgi:hypothetical protein